MMGMQARHTGLSRGLARLIPNDPCAAVAHPLIPSLAASIITREKRRLGDGEIGSGGVLPRRLRLCSVRWAGTRVCVFWVANGRASF